MSDDKLEIDALQAIVDAFAPLEDATRARVLRWAYSRYVDDVERLARELAEAESA